MILKTVLTAAGIFTSYLLAGFAGLKLASVDGTVSLIWPASGLAVAFLYRFGMQYAPLIAMASFAYNSTVQQWPIALGLALGSTSATMLCASVLKRRPFSPRFDSWRDAQTLALVGLATLALGAANSVAWLYGSGRIAAAVVPESFAVWLLGDLGGVLMFAPMILAAPPRISDALKTLKKPGILISTLFLLAVCAAVFLDLIPMNIWFTVLIFGPFYIASRTVAHYGTWPAAVHMAVTMAIVAYSVTAQVGPVKLLPAQFRHYAVWGYLTALAVSVLTTGGLIGEREQALKWLRAGEASFRNLIEDNPAYIIRFHHDGRLLFANETFRKNFGIDFGMSQGVNFLELAGLESVPGFQDKLMAHRFQDAAITAESQVRLRGEPHWIRWTARVVNVSSGQGIEFHAVGLDVTEQVMADAKRRQIEQQAIQTQKLESVGALAGGIAHEFNNLLTAVMGNTELAQMMLPESSEAQLLLSDVRTNARRAAELTAQLLNYSRRDRSNLGPADLSEIVRSVKDLFSVAVPGHCPLTTELAEGLPLVLAEESSLRQLIMSLVANSGEALLETGGSITVRTRFVNCRSRQWLSDGVPGAGGQVLLQVEDTGPGMTHDVKARLFEPFSTTKRPGRGLGLAAVLAIVREHKGSIGVCSRPGRGTCVSVLLPTIDPIPASQAEPFHDTDCVYCETRSDEDTPSEGYAAMPPCHAEIPRTGFSSHTRPRSRPLKIMMN